MEGFLLKKSKERNFGPSWLTDKKKSWNRRWFVLEDQTVTYYQDFDLLSDQPVNKKGSFLIRDCEVLPVSHKTKKNIFCVKDGQNTLFYVQADDAKLLGIWIRALTAAANGEHKPPELDYDSLYEKLGLDPEVEHEPSAVNRAFRQLALQDKTGRPEGFKELQEAFNHIMAFLNRQEESRTHRMAYYEAVVIKGGPGQGLGIVVQEEADGTNVVQSIRETLRIESITGEVGEEGIEEGDQLLKLGNNDVSQMPLIRVAQRMNDFRIPPGSRVKLTFGRKVLREEMGDEEYDYQEGDEEGEVERYNQDRQLDHEAIQENQRQYENTTQEEPTLNVELSASRDSFGYRREISDDREEPSGEHNAFLTEQEFKFEPSPQQVTETAAREAEREAAQKTLQKTLSKYGLDPSSSMNANTASTNAGLQRTPSTYAVDVNSKSELQRTPSAYSVHASNTTSPRSSLRPQSRPDSRSTSPAITQRPEDNRSRSPSQAVPFSGSQSQQRAPSPHFLPRSPTSRSPSPALTRKLSTSSNAGGFAGQQARAPSPGSSPRSASPSPRPFSLPVSALRSATSFRSPPQPKPTPAPTPAPAPAAAPVARNNSVAGMPGNNPAVTPEIKRAGSVSMINPKEYFVLSSMQSKSPAEIAEMKRDLDFCLKELAAASKRIESLEFHNTHLAAELARYKALYADSAHHERLLETQLEQYLLHSTVTAEFMEESMNDMILVSNQISSNQPIQVSESTNVYLEEMGLGEDESELDGSKASQRNAIAAAAAVDRSGLMLQKWAMTGDSIINKLNRFEETVQQVGGIHKTAAEIRASPRAVRQSAPAPAPPAPEPEPEVYASPPQSSANIRQPQQYRAGSGGPVMSPHNRSSAASTSNASTTLSRKAPTPNAYGQTSSPKTSSPKGHVNGYGLREYTPSAGPSAGLRVSTEPAGAQLTRHQSQQWQNHTASSYDKQHAPLERTASLNRIPVNDKSSPKPLVSTLMSRPLNTQR